jgi:methionyl-tRNA synthetase
LLVKQSRDSKYQRVLVCVAWPYVNGDLHVGHLGGCFVPADVYARFQRLSGREVLMVSGSDCFGTPITLEADKRQVHPEQLVAEYHPRILALYEKLCFSYDNYTKTDTKLHRKLTQDFFVKMFEQELIKTVASRQYYSVAEERFLPDRYVQGTCPVCGYRGADSDQCDNCSSLIAEGCLLDPYSKVTGSPVELRDSEQYAVDWSLLQGFAEGYFNNVGPNWRSWVQAETLKWLKEGLRERAITRDLSWGVSLPKDLIPSEQHLKDIDKKSIYVWFDAVIGYLSASQEWEEIKRGEGVEVKWECFWQETPELKHVYFMGKDNLVFHSIFWPSQLHAYDDKLKLPDVLAVNQFYRLNGEKFSKSKGITLRAEDLVNRFGSDALRFYLAANAPETADVDFTIEDFITKTNAILVGNIGNFISRTLTLALKISKEDLKIAFQNFPPSDEVKSEIEHFFSQADAAMAEVSTRAYCNALISLSAFANRYITTKAPWTIKDYSSPDYKEAIINSLYLVVALGVLLKPLTVLAVSRLEKMLGVEFVGFSTDIDFLTKLASKLELGIKENLFNKIEL